MVGLFKVEDDMKRRFWLVCVVVGSVAIGGCTSSGPKLHEVSGTVTFDGKAVSEGAIMFLPSSDKSLAPQGGTIKDGTYKLRAGAGSYRVQITATRSIPGKKGPMGAMGGDAVEQYIPVNYNEQTTLNAEVKDGQKNHIDFPLTSK